MYNPQGVVKGVGDTTQIIGVKRRLLRKFFCFKEVKICRKIRKHHSSKKEFFYSEKNSQIPIKSITLYCTLKMIVLWQKIKNL